MHIDLFDYELPDELIAQQPADRRDESRLLSLDRSGGAPVEHRFSALPTLLRAGDLLVGNDAKVVPARLYAQRRTGGVVEILLLREVEPADGAGAVWEALVRPGRRVREGEQLQLLNAGPAVTLREDAGGGRRRVQLPPEVTSDVFLDRWGQMPLPPYIDREPGDRRESVDRQRYQTVYARHSGAVAAPTAGLHFTGEVLEALRAAGVQWTTLTLDVGAGTFQPVRVDEVTQHHMEGERYEISEACVQAIVQTRRRGGRVVGVGTTVVRTLEYAAKTLGLENAAGEGVADIFIYPGFEFQAVDGMLTNFHLPRSTPMLMVSALVGRERLLAAYADAVAQKFRFFSYGDAMLVL